MAVLGMVQIVCPPSAQRELFPGRMDYELLAKSPLTITELCIVQVVACFTLDASSYKMTNKRSK